MSYKFKFCVILVMMMSMALMYGGSASTVNLRPSLRKVNSALEPIRIRKQQQTMISNARFTTPPTSLRSTSSSFVNSGLLRSEVDKFIHSIARSSYGGALSTECSVALSTEALRWLFGVAAVVLMLSKHTAINKSFLVPLLALEAPGDVFSWIRGDYGLWTAFLVFLVRLFYYIPGELELPFLFVLLVIIAPYQATNLRGTQAGMVISMAASAYLIYQHVTKTGGIKKAFDQGVVVPTIAAVFLICVPLVFFIQGFIF